MFMFMCNTHCPGWIDLGFKESKGQILEEMDPHDVTYEWSRREDS